jgi:polyferredoxin
MDYPVCVACHLATAATGGQQRGRLTILSAVGTGKRTWRYLILLLSLYGLAVLAAGPAQAESIAELYPQARGFFPAADSFGELSGTPPAAEVRARGKLVGYLYLSSDVLQLPAYSGRPINTLVGFDLHGRITGVSIVAHEEPILLAGVSEARLNQYVQQYPGNNLYDDVAVGGAGLEGRVSIDTISGATITVMVENATIMRSARIVAASRGVTRPVMPPAPIAAAAVGTRTHSAASPAQATKRSVARDAPPAAPAQAHAQAAPADTPLWVGVWRQRGFHITVLGAGLLLLSLILIFQDWLARHPHLLIYVRDGFLVYTVIFIGWYGLAQLSVVNVLTFTHAMMSGFNWQSFLIDPMLFMLWSFVAVTLLLWGRGVYCGWLCPYGAMQELINQVALKWLKLRQWEFPDVVHERLWALKYIVLLALFGLSLQSLADAERYAEIEPFKTAVALRFQREWGYVFYAVALLLVSLVNRKFYCKYLCPLGAALTIPARFRIFSWLRRRKECGSPCQVCAKECEVRAINSIGEINANECHYCLDCQVTYYNDRKCPPLADRRKRREKGARARELVLGMEAVIGASGLEKVEPGTPSCDSCSQGCQQKSP